MRTLCLLLMLAVVVAIPPVARADDAPAAKAKNVTLVLEEVDVVTAINKLATMAGMNVIVSPKVKGQVSLEFRDTSFLTALQQVAKACGCVVQEEGSGIYTVVPKQDMAAKILAPPYKRLLLDGKVVRGRIERAQVLQLHNVKDLAKSNVDLLLLTGHGQDKEISKVTLREGAGALVVMGTPAAQKRVSKRLEALRKALAAGEPFDRVTVAGKTYYMGRFKTKFNKDGDVIVSLAGTVVRGRVVDKAGVPQLRALLVPQFSSKDHIEATAKAEALRKQAEQLKKAGVLLKSAGDKAGAERAYARAKRAYAAAQAAIKEARKARDARDVAIKARVRMEAASTRLRVNSTLLDIDRSTTAGSVVAIEKLRHEVRALRGEVRELTGLVRQLLAK